MVEVRARAWVLSDVLEFPEWELASVRRKPNVGLCLSGGGTRSLCASVGFLRGLHQLGLLERVRYIGAVSGGSWVTVPYSFYERGPADDAELFGPIVLPKHLRKDMLELELPRTELAATATQSFREALLDDMLKESTGAAWVGAVGQIFLAPFGLYEHGRPRSYTLDDDSLAALLALQPDGSPLHADDFTLLRPNRPFPVIQSTLLGPASAGEVQRVAAVSLQFTPLYVGCPVRHEVEFDYRFGVHLHRDIGGALVEPVAFGTVAPLEVRGAVGDYAFAGLAAARELAFMAGTSSTAYAEAMQHVPELKDHPDRVPCARYWPHHTDKGLETEVWEMGDGGLMENYGLLPLIQRGVETAIVLVNTVQPLDLEYVPGKDSYKKRVDDYLPPLFGVLEDSPGLGLEHNQVFPTSEYAELITALQAAKRAGDPLVVVREHELLENQWWHIHGGRKLRVVWVYLDRVARFEAQLPDETAHAIKMGNHRPRLGPCKGFPNYDTIDENFLELVQLTPYQVRLLTQLQSWVVLDKREVFEALLG